ncbi:cell division protein FtsK, partial [Nocardia rhizosphaerihabitans]
MAGKSRSTTTSRARAGSSRGQTPSARSRSTTPRASAAPRGRTAPARRPVNRASNTAPLAVIGRGVGSGWTMLARGVGATTRTLSRAGEIEHGHRRDGIGLALIAVSAIIAAAMWMSAGGPVGRFLEDV